MAGAELLLVRHGRSAHRHSGWVDHAGFRAWREVYEAAGIDADHPPPRRLARLTESAARVVASDAPRAAESARRLAPGRELELSPLLRELDLDAPDLGSLRLPLALWAVAVGLQMLRLSFGKGYPAPPERSRVEAAREWLEKRAEGGGLVIAVTHASLRRQLALHLVRAGWQPRDLRRSAAPWSSWRFVRPGTS